MYTVSIIIKMMRQQIKTMCIPRISRGTTKQFIKNTVNKCNFGEIKSIVEKPLRNEIDYKKVIIRLLVDNFTINGSYLLKNTEKGNTIKIVYNNFEYWKLVNIGL